MTDTDRGTPGARSGPEGGIEVGRPGSGRRLGFVSADLERLPGSRLHISVTLRNREREVRAEAEGVGGTMVELRLAAEATLEAVTKALEGSDLLELIGLKTVHAFDTDLVLAAVRTHDDPGHTLVGAVPVEDDAPRAAVIATLDAVNRVVGPRLDG